MLRTRAAFACGLRSTWYALGALSIARSARYSCSERLCRSFPKNEFAATGKPWISFHRGFRNTQD